MNPELTDVQRQVLADALEQLSVEGRCTNALAGLVGLATGSDLADWVKTTLGHLRMVAPLEPLDWLRATGLAELTALSSFLGMRLEWSRITGLSEHDTLEALMGIERTVNGLVERSVPSCAADRC